MNTTLHIVTEIMGEPYTMYGKWFVKVLADSYLAADSGDIMMFDTKEAAEYVFVGYEYDE
jgi:hypothetical protein